MALKVGVGDFADSTVMLIVRAGQSKVEIGDIERLIKTILNIV